MKISERWLRELINPSIDTNTLIEQMIMIGFEVNNLEPVINLFSGVIIGKVVECLPHPNLSRFLIIKVYIGEKKLLNIVCNDNSCNQDSIVAVALPGTILPKNKKNFFYKFNGEFPEGILCTFSELGLSNNNEVIKLPNDTPVGISIEDYLNLPDNILDVNVLTNRADCNSVIGIAREISVINKLSISPPKFKFFKETIDDIIPIKIKEPQFCPRYICRIIKNININTISPLWMIEKLHRIGINSVNIIQDICNYILIELGQPIQIIDLNNVKYGIFIRKAQDKESLLLSNGRKISLSSDTLVITNTKQVLSIAGINNIDYVPQDILLSIAFVNTDEGREVDPSLQYYALERATSLLVSICGGNVGPLIDNTNAEFFPQLPPINLRKSKLDKLIGYSIYNEKVNEILTSLGYKVVNIHDGWKVIKPSWRFDVEIEEDLVEDIIRIYGYNNIPIIPINPNIEVDKKTKFSLDRVKTLLVDRSYQEIITYSFVNPQIQQILYPEQIPLSLRNPITIEMSVMRISLLTGLLCTVLYNQNRQYRQIRLFESGLCFSSNNHQTNFQINQYFMLAGVITGFRFDEHWDVNKENIDFYDAKGDLESIFELMGKLNQIKFKKQINDTLHPGKSAAIYLNKELIGFIGVINPEIEKKLNLTGNCVLFELFWDKMNKYNKPQIKKISKYPSNRRDISIIVSDDISAADIISTCREVIGNKLVNIKLFDIFKGKNIKKGYKSLSISLILQAYNYTMEEKEINTIIINCYKNLKNKFGASCRN